MGQVSIYEAAELLAPPGPDSETYRKMILRELLRAAEAGDIAAEKIAPWEPLCPILSGASRKQVLEKVIDSRSLVSLMDVCVWRASGGGEISKRTLSLLSAPDQARLAGAFSPPAEHGGKKAEKLLMVIGALLREFDPEMRTKFKHGGKLNVSALAMAVGGRITEEHGPTHGFKESTISEIIREAINLFPLAAESGRKAA